MLILPSRNTTTSIKAGFTIVELLIVIVVIGIIASIITIGYSGIKRNATVNVTKNALTSAMKAMINSAAESGSYATSFPSTISPSADIGLALTVVSDTATFCINATNTQYDDIAWHASPTTGVTEGLCDGSVIVPSIIGTYNYSAHIAGGSATPVQNSAGVGIGDGGGFVVRTNDDWTSMQLSWDAVSGATRYEVQYRTSNVATWYLANIETGNGPYSTGTYSGNSTYSAQIPASTTSLTWTYSATRPVVGATYEYRVRSYNGTTASGWNTATLAIPPNSSFPVPTNFHVTPNSTWSSHTVSWNADTTTMPGAIYEFQYRTSSSATWYLASISAGSGGNSVGTYGTSSGFTAMIPASTTSLTWAANATRPTTAGQTYEYQIRVKSSTLTNVYSAWTTTTLSPPGNELYPTVSGFSVTQNGAWTAHTIAWNAADTSIVPDPRYEFQYRTSSSATWYLASISAGSGGNSIATYGTTSTHTAMIPITTTSLTWASNATRPTATGQTYEYQIRVRSMTITGGYGPWTSTTLSR